MAVTLAFGNRLVKEPLNKERLDRKTLPNSGRLALKIFLSVSTEKYVYFAKQAPFL